MNRSEVITTVRLTADKLGLDPDLAQAIACVESAFYAYAYRFEPGWQYFYEVDHFAGRLGLSKASEKNLQAASYGPMQVMGAVARELGFNETITQLLIKPEVAILYACKKLKKLSEKYEDERAVIASYNAGSPRKLPGIGPNGTGSVYVNQGYVDKVSKELRAIRGRD